MLEVLEKECILVYILMFLISESYSYAQITSVYSAFFNLVIITHLLFLSPLANTGYTMQLLTTTPTPTVECFAFTVVHLQSI